MRNVILVTKKEGVSSTKHFILLDDIKAVEVTNRREFRLYTNEGVWFVPREEFECIMNAWAPYYRDLKEYQEYLKSK